MWQVFIGLAVLAPFPLAGEGWGGGANPQALASAHPSPVSNPASPLAEARSLPPSPARGEGKETQGEKLTVKNVRPTLCPLGPTRADANYLPGDVVHVTFDVGGFKLDDEGRYRLGARLVVEDPAGKAILTEDYGFTPARVGALAGGRSRFAFRYIIPPELPAATYKAKLQLTDPI